MLRGTGGKKEKKKAICANSKVRHRINHDDFPTVYFFLNVLLDLSFSPVASNLQEPGVVVLCAWRTAVFPRRPSTLFWRSYRHSPLGLPLPGSHVFLRLGLLPQSGGPGLQHVL